MMSSTNNEMQHERLIKLNQLTNYFLCELVEDARDGTPFDCAVLDTFDLLKMKWGGEEITPAVRAQRLAYCALP